MKIQEIFKGKKDEINLSIKPSIKGEAFGDIKNIPSEISFSQDAYWLITNENRIEIEGITKKDNQELERVAQNNSIIVIIQLKKQRVEVKAKLLIDIIHLTEGLEIGLDDIIIDDINKRFSRKIAQKKTYRLAN
jgi:hypothetical protein